MENSLKQRIIGAVVLIALGVIFLPAILKEKTSNGVFESKIPEKPSSITEYKMDTHKIDELIAKEKERSREIEKEAKKAKLELEQSSEAEVINETSTDKAVQEQGTGNSEPLVSTTPIEREEVPLETGGAGAWVIQVASFSKQENAIKLVSKLKENGHKAYKSRVKVKTNIVFRVFVGPFIKKNLAQKSVADIDKVAGIKSMVRVFNPIKH